MSAGNHAQGVAYHAPRLGIPATIVMPKGTPFTKVERTAGFGAQGRAGGRQLDDGRGLCPHTGRREQGLTFVHPYDDPLIVAGQGTIGLEMLEDVPDLDDVVVPIGGGGLIAGIAIAAKALKPDDRDHRRRGGLYPSMHDAVRRPQPRLCAAQTIADGIAVKSPGPAHPRDHRRRWSTTSCWSTRTTLERAVHMLVERPEAGGRGRRRRRRWPRCWPHPERFAGREVGDRHLRRQHRRAAAGVGPDARTGPRRPLVRLRIEIDDRAGRAGQRGPA